MEDESLSEDISSYNIDSEIAVNLFNRYWDIFNNLDSRRIKSFLQLILFILLILLLKLNPHKEFNIPFVEYKVDLSIAIILAPLLISVFFFRFVLLSALTINAQAKHNRYFLYLRKTLAKKFASKPVMLDELREYELSEIPNMFLFPIPFDKSATLSRFFKKKLIIAIVKVLRRFIKLLINISFIVFTLLPLIVNIYIIFFEFETIYLEIPVNKIFFWMYLSMTILILSAIIYLYLIKTRQSREELINVNSQTTF
jgi:hypothetical protein